MANEDLRDLIEDEDMDEQDRPESRFSVRDDQTAMWCVRKYQKALDEYKALQEHYKAQLERAAARVERIRQMAEWHLMEYMESGLVPLHETKTMYTYELPGAKLKLTKETKVLVHDDEVLLPALKAAGRTEYIKTKESVDWAGLKKEIQQTGEMIDGVTLETKEPEIKIEMKEGAT